MESRERLNVYFEMEGLPYLLFRVVNIGTKDNPDFKFSGFSDFYINYRSEDNGEDDKGFLTEEEMEKRRSQIDLETHQMEEIMKNDLEYRGLLIP